MDSYELIEKQRKELQKMSTLARNYQQSALGEQEIDRFLLTRNSIPVEGSQEQQTRERLKEMMMVDTLSAEALRDDFPDLYCEAYLKTERLQAQANPGTMEKIKHDFWGSKRRSARAALKDIADNRKKVIFKSAKEYALDQLDEIEAQTRAKIRTAQSIIEDNTKSPEEKEAARRDLTFETQRLEEADLNKDPDEIERTKATENPISSCDRLESSKDYRVKLALRQDELINKTSLSRNVLFRDMAWFTSKYNREGQFTDDEWMKTTDDVRVVQSGKHMRLIDGNGEDEVASPTEKERAFLDTKAKLEEKMADMRDFQYFHPEFFGDILNVDCVVENYSDLNRAFKMMQVVTNVAKELVMGRNTVFNNMDITVKREAVELAVYLGAVKIALQRQIILAREYASDENAATSSGKEYQLKKEDRYVEILKQLRKIYADYTP